MSNAKDKVGSSFLIAGALAFFVGIGGIALCNNDKEAVLMSMKGCWTRMEGSKHSVSEHFYCRFEDQRVNENIDIAYHPLAYKEMSSYPVGTKFWIEAESLSHKKNMDIFVPAIFIGLMGIAMGLVIGLIDAATSSNDKRW